MMTYLFHTQRTWLLIFAICCTSLIISCEPETKEKEEECYVHPGVCEGCSYSFVDFNTQENLIGTNGHLIHPDSIVITNTRGDTMPHYEEVWLDGWVNIGYFNPFDELTCGSLCENDSAFTRTYYMYLNKGDTDTLEIIFPEMTSFYIPFYNGVKAEKGIDYSVFCLKKKIKRFT